MSRFVYMSSCSVYGVGQPEQILDETSPVNPQTAYAECKVRVERDVLALIGEGLSNNDIADRLEISEKTVRNHASNIFDKLGVWSRAQAIVFARDRGFQA